jgi:hypothetical protein
MRVRLSSLRIALLVLLAASFAVPAAAQPGSEPPPYPELAGTDADAIRETVRDYQDAVLRRDGPAAARLVSRESRGYYARMRQMAVSAPEAQVRAAPLMDRMTILMYRHRVPADQLRALDGDAAFEHTISDGWVTGMDGEDIAARAGIYGQGDRAIIRYDGDMHLVREEGAWRLDMMPSILAASDEFAEGMESRAEQDEFLLFVMKESNGRDPSPDIWQPVP